MKRYIKEDINVGDEVFIPGDEYHATVIAIKGDRVKVDGPMGVEYKNMSELEKQESEEDMPPPSFGRPSSMERQFKPRGFGGYVSENRKKVVRLTESDLTRIIKRVISEQPNSGMFGGEPSTGKPTPTRTSTPTTGQAQKPTTGQAQGSKGIAGRLCKQGEKGQLTTVNGKYALITSMNGSVMNSEPTYCFIP